MKKIGLVIIGIAVLIIGILSIPKEVKQILIEEKNDKNTSLAFYLEQENGNYEESSNLPSTGYTLNTERSICTNNTTPIWKDNKLYLNNLETDGTSCYLYFNIYKPTAGEQILENYSTQLTRTDFSQTVTNTTTGTIYKSLNESQYDNYGEVYYFAGNPTDNWVKFAGFYWRIIRINGDGTIRLIYQGTSANMTGEDTQIGTSAFNSLYNNNMYVGYMYTSGQVYGLGTDSTIKGVLDNWYQSNIASQASKIDGNVGFCGNRTPSTSYINSNGLGGTGTTETYYGGYFRLSTNKTPSYKCTNSSDLYTTSESSNGNKALSNPIGLISADEVAFAGGVFGLNNNSFYLYTNSNYWTMTPYNNISSTAQMFPVNIFGMLSQGPVQTLSGVRPVINLKSSVQIISGKGTATDPYIVEGAA